MATNVSLARRLVRHRGALVGLVILGALALMALARAVAEPARSHQDGAAGRAAAAGRDVLAR